MAGTSNAPMPRKLAAQRIRNTSDVDGQFGGQDAGFYGGFPSHVKN
jgi:hypothetical protein